MKTFKLAVALVPLVVVLSCATTVDSGVEGAGTYTWRNRELTGVFAGPLLDVAPATERAFQELRLIGVDQVVDGLKGTVTAKTADGTRVKVKLKAVDFSTTRFVIKVGTFGDKAMSQQVARYIARELASPHHS